MSALPIAFRSNAGRYNFLGTTSLINAFAEQQGGDAKGPLAVLPCHGTLNFADVTDTPCRGMIYMPDLDVVVSVHENSVYTTTSTGATTRRGVIPGIGNVQFARNQKTTPQLVILADGVPWLLENNIVSKITDADLPAPVQSVTGIGGYIVYGLADGRFFLSAINEASNIDALDFATAEQSPDRLVRVFADGQDLYLCGGETIEPWRNTGNSEFPFEPMPSVIKKGLMAAGAIALCDNSIMWPGHDGIVYRLNGYQPVRISNGEVERAIQSDADQASIIATVWAIGGHAFYNLTGSTWSYTYDAATQAWHKRESYGDTRWRHQSAVFAWSKVIMGDRNSGSLYYLDKDTYTEAGQALIWGVDSPPMHAFPNGGICDAIHFDLATGVGVTSPTAQGYDPKLMLSWSDDGGNTFNVPRELSLGRRGNYRARVKANRTGRLGPQGRVWRLRISDPVPRALVNVDAKVRPLAK